ncbi:putative secreted protein [Rhizobium phage Paso]|uniref:Putative secreted protein n=1 Tax=Rhizobium phage Paso TaxID=2767574 RepID=A0A7L8G717_9CAUD|nr:putative secreted protein [Rhizobium phage Paso]
MAFEHKLATLIVALTALVFVAFALPGKARAADYNIKFDGGGDTQLYVKKAYAIKAKGQRIAINGDCASACVLLLHSQVGNDVCVGPKARLGFHMAWRGDLKARNLDRSKEALAASTEVKRIIVAGLPDGLKHKVDAAPWPSVYKGADHNDAYWVSYKVLRSYYPACK